MRYKIYGYAVPYKGKPIWEIVGNLKNFGEGRLIVEDEHKDKYVEPCFYKIVKVQPMEAPTKVGEIRNVLLWAEYVLKGVKLSQYEQLQPISQLTKFHLIPKEEEGKYLAGITTTPKITILPKYQTWPPLYKKIWEMRMTKATGKHTVIPPLATVINTDEKSFEALSSDDAFEQPAKSDLFQTNTSVEELFKKIVLLQKELGIKRTVEES